MAHASSSWTTDAGRDPREVVNSPAWDAVRALPPTNHSWIFGSERAGGHSYSDLYVIFTRRMAFGRPPSISRAMEPVSNIDDKHTAQVNPSISGLPDRLRPTNEYRGEE